MVDFKSLSSRAASALQRTAPALPSATAPPVPEPLAGVELECVPTDAGDMWFPRSEEVIRPFLKTHGTWEPEEGAVLRRFLRPGCRFLDVGANVGYFSLFAHRVTGGCEIDAVEPFPANVSLLRLNLWANGVGARVWPVALTDGLRLVTLSSPITNPGDTRAAAGAAGTTASAIAAGVPGDELFVGRRFDLVKLDVQGFELDVIAGMQTIIRNSPGIAIVAEFMPSAVIQRGLEPGFVLAQYRRMGLSITTQVGGVMREQTDDETLDTCVSAGTDGQVNLILQSL